VQGWKEELSERVENFRRRRARLRRSAGSAENLELDFENYRRLDEPVFIDDTVGSPEESEPGFDLELSDSEGAPPRSTPGFEAISLEDSGEDLMPLPTTPAPLEEMPLEGSAPERRPMEIVVGSPEEVTQAEEEAPEGMLPGPLSRRFLAGLMDTLVLVLGAALFGIIFWRSGGHLSPNPINFTILGVVALIFIFAYFGLFTALTSTTPGLLWMGYEIRNMRGTYPTPRESFWRAFGILVSLSALMLGFVWAWVDSDTLTWHDRMSGTFITAARTGHETYGLETEA
jgi:uncharacterized RDD family membrane protein YckC